MLRLFKLFSFATMSRVCLYCTFESFNIFVSSSISESSDSQLSMYLCCLFDLFLFCATDAIVDDDLLLKLLL
jgi:hypothetical protein